MLLLCQLTAPAAEFGRFLSMALLNNRTWPKNHSTKTWVSRRQWRDIQAKKTASTAAGGVTVTWRTARTSSSYRLCLSSCHCSNGFRSCNAWNWTNYSSLCDCWKFKVMKNVHIFTVSLLMEWINQTFALKTYYFN